MNELLHKILFLPEQASTVATRVDHLHYFVILTTLIASFLIGTLALVFFVRYRRRSDDQRTPHVRAPLALEAAFVAVPLSFFLLWFALGFRDYVVMVNPPPSSMDVYVMAKQWMWTFAYPDGPSALSALTVPARRPVRLLLTSRDVIHSFYVPAFRIKLDVLPGRYTQGWFEAVKPGRYPILCAEYCGLVHSGMRGEVVVLEPAAFDRWMDEQGRGLAERQDASVSTEGQRNVLAQQGERVAVAQGCLRCHTLDGTSHIGPTWLGLYKRREPLAGGRTVVADEAYLTESMMEPRQDVVLGFAPVMPSYMGRLAPAEVAALLELIKSLGEGSGT